MDLKIEDLRYTCCFCNQHILSGKADPCDLNILINIDKPKEQRSNQTFYCHIACFKDRMCPEVRYYFMLDLLGSDDEEDEKS